MTAMKKTPLKRQAVWCVVTPSGVCLSADRTKSWARLSRGAWLLNGAGHPKGGVWQPGELRIVRAEIRPIGKAKPQ